MLATFFLILGIIIYFLRNLIPLVDVFDPVEAFVKLLVRGVIKMIALFLMGYAFWLWGWRIVNVG